MLKGQDDFRVVLVCFQERLLVGKLGHCVEPRLHDLLGYLCCLGVVVHIHVQSDEISFCSATGDAAGFSFRRQILDDVLQF